MKRFVILILALCLCFPAATSAESLFDFLITPAPEVSDKAPSYGAMANVDASDVQDYGEKGQAVTYEGVDEDGYNGFIKYLAELGYEAVQSNATDQSVEMIVNNGTFNIGLAYYAKEQKLMLVYDQGVAFEKRDVLKANFADAKRIELGQEFEVKGVGKFKFTDFTLGGSIDREYYFYFGGSHRSTYSINTWVEFDYYNTSTDTVTFDDENPFISQLKYINDDEIYSYPIKVEQSIAAIGIYKAEQNLIGADSVNSLTSEHMAVAFELPDGALNSMDGFIVLELTFNTENQEHYILVLREDGKKVGEW